MDCVHASTSSGPHPGVGCGTAARPGAVRSDLVIDLGVSQVGVSIGVREVSRGTSGVPVNVVFVGTGCWMNGFIKDAHVRTNQIPATGRTYCSSTDVRTLIAGTRTISSLFHVAHARERCMPVSPSWSTASLRTPCTPPPSHGMRNRCSTRSSYAYPHVTAV